MNIICNIYVGFVAFSSIFSYYIIKLIHLSSMLRASYFRYSSRLLRNLLLVMEDKQINEKTHDVMIAVKLNKVTETGCSGWEVRKAVAHEML